MKLCFLCERALQNNNQINKDTLATYMRHQINLRYEKFKIGVGDNIINYHLYLIHFTCYDKIKKELDFSCGDSRR